MTVNIQIWSFLKGSARSKVVEHMPHDPAVTGLILSLTLLHPWSVVNQVIKEGAFLPVM